MFHSNSKDKNVKTASSLALFLVFSLGLNACGEEKKNKRHQTEVEKVAQVVEPKQNDTAVEGEKQGEVNKPTEDEKKTEESKNDTPAVPAVDPASPVVDPVTPVVEPQEPVVEPTPEDKVACTMDAAEYCVQTGKNTFEKVYFSRSAPDCNFPEAPVNAVNALFCEKNLDNKSL
jgi:hypothetical protein